MRPTRLPLLRLLFGLDGTVDGRTYAVVGLVLMALKLSGDALIVALATNSPLHPGLLWQAMPLRPVTSSFEIYRLLLIWAMPFAWIGLSMSVRRALDAGRSPWLGLLFCVPGINLVLMLALCLLPSQAPRGSTWGPEAGERGDAVRAVGLAMLVVLATAAFTVVALDGLGLALFAGSPLGMGLVLGYSFNHRRERSLGQTMGLALVAVLACEAIVLLLALDGLICALLAFPLALAFTMIGATIGWSVARRPVRHGSPAVFVLIVVPLVAVAEPALRTPYLHEVTSEVTIDASPAEVWDRVVAFPPLAPPEELWFRYGIAYPTRATIEGAGVGAIRRCEFSTGTFVEPITAWEPPRRLAFDVVAEPSPLRELSPYKDVYLTHRHRGGVHSRRGEFRLEDLGDGRTRLVGTTWYELSLAPEAYWSLWSDAIIRSIHLRVLRHIAVQAEG